MYSTRQNKEPEGGVGWVKTRPRIYLFAPLLFQALEKKAKEECKKRERKVIMCQLAGTKEELVRKMAPR